MQTNTNAVNDVLFCEISWTLKIAFDLRNSFLILWWSGILWKILFDWEVITVSADGWAPLCARPSAGLVMTTVKSLI